MSSKVIDFYILYSYLEYLPTLLYFQPKLCMPPVGASVVTVSSGNNRFSHKGGTGTTQEDRSKLIFESTYVAQMIVFMPDFYLHTLC